MTTADAARKHQFALAQKTTAIYTEVTIRQLQEVHARCHPSARPTEEKPLSQTEPNQ